MLVAAVCHSCHLASLKVRALSDSFTLSVKSSGAAKVGKARDVPPRVKLADGGGGVRLETTARRRKYILTLVCTHCEECVGAYCCGVAGCEIWLEICVADLPLRSAKTFLVEAIVGQTWHMCNYMTQQPD